MRRSNHTWRRLTAAAFFFVLVVSGSACRHAASQTPIQIGDTERLYTRDIDLPLPLTDRAEQILYRKAYVVSYNKDTRQPNWVAWHLTADHTDGNVGRPTTAWHEDTDVPEPRAQFYDYSRTGWDRGHHCPAGDNKWDADAMYESFLMTNASPQHKTLNSGIWNQIEINCRNYARRHGSLYIVCGPLFYDQEHDTIGPNCIPVPEAFFKVVADLSTTPPRAVGYVCRNNEGSQKKDLYVNSVAEVERLTGIKFFPHTDGDEMLDLR